MNQILWRRGMAIHNSLWIFLVSVFLLFQPVYGDDTLPIQPASSAYQEKVFQILYADAKAIRSLFLVTKLTNNPRKVEGSQWIFAETTDIRADPRRNTIIAQLPDEQFILLDKIIAEFDKPNLMFSLDIYILEVTADYAEYLKKNVDILQAEQLENLLNTMQQQGKGKIFGRPRVLTENKKIATIIPSQNLGCCSCAEEELKQFFREAEQRRDEPRFSFEVMPELLKSSQIKLDLIVKITEKTDNFKPFEAHRVRYVNNRQSTVIADLDYSLTDPDNNQTKLVIILTPHILEAFKK